MNISTVIARGFAIVAIGTSVFAADMALAEKKAQPLNAGKAGIKSNAGGGNGTEDQVGATTVVETVNVSTYTYNDVTTGEPVVVSVTETQTETDRVETDSRLVGCGKNKPCNLQTTYLVTYDVTTTTGTETTTTTQVVEVTETTKVSTATTDIYDIDPGQSQPVNQAPEGEPEDVVVVTEEAPVVTEANIGDPMTEVTEASTSEVTGTTTAEKTETTPCNNDQCN